MSQLRFDNLGGIAPSIPSKKLAENLASEASNARLDRARLEGWRDYLLVEGLGSMPTSIFRTATGTWLTSADERHYVRSIIPNDQHARVFLSATSYPMVRGATGAFFRLGLPRPQPVSIGGGTNYGSQTDPTLVEDVYYKITWVDAFGAEGPGSAFAGPYTIGPGFSMVLNLPSLPTPSSGSYNWADGTKIRIYRSNTGTEATVAQYVGEVTRVGGVMPNTFTDNRPSDQLEETLVTNDWIGPPDDDASLYPTGPIKQLTAYGNTLVGFTGNTLCLCEPNVPHAWPIDYRYTVKEEIEAIAVTSVGILILTDGRTYAAVGNHPSSLALQPLDTPQACMSRASVVSVQGAAIFASPDGLCSSDGSVTTLLTAGIIDRDTWQADYSPSTIRGFQYEGMYIGFYGAATAGTGFVFDPRDPQRALMPLAGKVSAGFWDESADALYLATQHTDSSWRISQFNAGATRLAVSWTSKLFDFPTPETFSAARVVSDTYPVTVTVYANGVQLDTYAVPDGAPYRLPSGERSKEWQFKFEFPAGGMSYVVFATSMAELS